MGIFEQRRLVERRLTWSREYATEPRPEAPPIPIIPARRSGWRSSVLCSGRSRGQRQLAVAGPGGESLGGREKQRDAARSP